MALVVTALSFGIFVDESFADGTDNQSFTVAFDKEQYHSGDTLRISGEILEMGMPVIAMSIFDPDEKILSANNLEVSLDETFSKSVTLDPAFYKKTGEYTVKLDYGQVSERYSFVIAGSNDRYDEDGLEQNDSNTGEQQKPATQTEPKIVSLYTEKKRYTDQDTLLIRGQVSSLESPTVLIGVYDPFGTPTGFYFGMINPDLEFSASFLVKDGVNFKADGTYSVKAHYAETEAVSSFEYGKESITTPTIDNTPQNTNEAKSDDDNSPSPHEPSTTNPTTNEPSTSSTGEKTNTQKISQETSDSSTNSIPATKKNSDDKLESKTNNNNKNSNSDDSIVEKEKTTTATTANTSNNNNDPKIKNSETITKQTITKENISEKNSETTIPKKHSNLSVEDIELGKLLNQINLACDPSALTDTISYYDGMGPALYRLCKFDSSLDSFNKSLIENPNDVDVLVNKGSALGKMGLYSEAIVHYDQAIKIDPDFLPAKNNKANALVNTGNYRDAILLYDQILTENPGYVTARNNLEIVLSEKSSYELISNIPLAEKSQPVAYNEKTITVPEDMKYSYSNSTGKTNSNENAEQKPANFFEEVGFAFSSLFGFLGN